VPVSCSFEKGELQIGQSIVVLCHRKGGLDRGENTVPAGGDNQILFQLGGVGAKKIRG